MAARKKKKIPLEQKIDALTTIVAKGFAAVAEDISKLATKGQVIALHTQVNSIERDLRDIKRRLTGVEDNVSGYRKESDHALERIAAIEKHLGINKKIAA